MDIRHGSEGERGSSFRALFDDHLGYVLASLRRMGVSERDREDLAHEVFLRVAREFDRYDRARPLKPWLFAFVFRVASDYRRAARHRVEIFGESIDFASPSASPHDALALAEARAQVDRALATLDDEKRAVFILHELDETPIPIVAAALSIAEGTAYSRLRAAREQFAGAIRRGERAQR